MSEKVVAYRLDSSDVQNFNSWERGAPPEDVIKWAKKVGRTFELAYSESHVRALEEQCRGLAESLKELDDVFCAAHDNMSRAERDHARKVLITARQRLRLAHYRSGSHE